MDPEEPLLNVYMTGSPGSGFIPTIRYLPSLFQAHTSIESLDIHFETTLPLKLILDALFPICHRLTVLGLHFLADADLTISPSTIREPCLHFRRLAELSLECTAVKHYFLVDRLLSRIVVSSPTKIKVVLSRESDEASQYIRRS